jgi:hypothetical protein
MTKTELAPYVTARQRVAVGPAYLLRFAHVPEAGLPTEYDFTRDFASRVIPGGPLPAVLALGRPSGNVQTVETEEGRSSIGTFNLPLVDLEGEVMRQLSDPAVPLGVALTASARGVVEAGGDVSGYPSVGVLLVGDERIRYGSKDNPTGRFFELTRGAGGTLAVAHAAGELLHNGEQLRAGQRVRLYAGYGDLDFSQWLKFTRMEITRIALADSVTFVVTVADIQRTLRRAVFTGATSGTLVVLFGDPITLALRVLLSTGGAVAGAGTVQVTDANTITGVGTSFISFLRSGDFILIDPFSTTEQFATVAGVQTDTVLTTVEPLVTGAAGLGYRKAGSGGRYDLHDSANGLGVPAAFVDVAGLEALRTRHFAGQRFHFRLGAPEEAKAFLERELWKPSNCYPFITQDGAYSARRYPGLIDPPVASLGEDDCVSYAWINGEERMVNAVEFTYDWNESGTPDQYKTFQRYTAVLSKKTFGPKRTFRLSSKGIHTAQNGQSLLDDRALRLLQRFSEPPPVVQLVVRYQRHVLDVGDTVFLTHRHVPNVRTGRRGVTDEIFEIRDLRPFFGAEGKVLLTLLHTGAVRVIATPVSDGVKTI